MSEKAVNWTQRGLFLWNGRVTPGGKKIVVVYKWGPFYTLKCKNGKNEVIHTVDYDMNKLDDAEGSAKLCGEHWLLTSKLDIGEGRLITRQV